MSGKIDPLFADHPTVRAMEEQTRKFVDEFRREAAREDLDALHQKENEIAHLLTDNIVLRGHIKRALKLLASADNAMNVPTVGTAVEVLKGALAGKPLSPPPLHEDRQATYSVTSKDSR